MPAAFLPSRHGFAFSNTWPAQPGVAIPFRGRTIGVGNAARGLCGGMVFAALDYWHAGILPPAQRPAAATPLYQFIVRRLIDSWHIPAGVARYYRWMITPGADYRLTVPGRDGPARPGVRRMSVTQQWPLIRVSIDAGQPAAVGVVTVASGWPGLLGRNHQVLAYDYEQAGSRVSMAVYDPNSGPDDRIRITFDTAGRAAGPGFEHNLSIGWPVRGFFLTRYSPAAPPVPAVR